jgi:hypothetical protein
MSLEIAFGFTDESGITPEPISRMFLDLGLVAKELMTEEIS